MLHLHVAVARPKIMDRWLQEDALEAPPRAAAADAATDQPAPSRKKRRKSDRSKLTIAEWVVLIERYKKGKYRSKQQFLRDAGLNGDTYRVQFGNRLKQHAAGVLTATTAKHRVRLGKHRGVEKKLVEYIQLRRKLVQRDKCGLSHSLLQAKALQFARDLGVGDDFHASPGWLTNVLRRNDLARVGLQGEAGDYDEAERVKVMNEFKRELTELMTEHDISLDRIYNADQTGLYYQKLPNTMYVNTAEKHTARGVKQMKDKTRLTLMVCTSATGEKVPLHMVGKSKKPACFRLLAAGKKLPLFYTNQKRAWYDKHQTVTWLRDLFLPHVLKTHGDKKVILLLDNCSAHKVDTSMGLLKHVHILFFPPNLTCWHQPADMGVIQSLKVGDKGNVIETLLNVCDDPALHRQARVLAASAKPGCVGLKHGAKPHVLDAMDVLQKVWSRDDKYASTDGIIRCWLRANCLPTPLQAELQSGVEPGRNRVGKYRLPDAELNALCMSMLHLTTAVEGLDDAPPAVADSYADNCGQRENLNQEQLRTMMESWCFIENDPNVVDFEIEEEMELLTLNSMETDEHNSDFHNGTDNEDDAATTSTLETMEPESTGLDVTLTSEESLQLVRLLGKFRQDATFSRDSRSRAFDLENSMLSDQLRRRARQSSLHNYFNVAAT